MNTRKLILEILVVTIMSSLIVVLLYTISEDTIHRNNTLIRRYPHHPITDLDHFNLGINSYYIAGKTEDAIYLGNISAPLHVLKLSLDLTDTTALRITLTNKEKYDFTYIRIRISGYHFYVMDGTAPIIFKGSIIDWIARPLKGTIPYFTQSEPTGGDGFFIKSRSASINEDKLGNIRFEDTALYTFNSDLLTKKIDGIFDTDGMLRSDPVSKRLVYTYYYRNKFFTSDTGLTKLLNGTTIDTASSSQLQVATLKNQNVNTLEKKPRLVNISSSAYYPYLFIQSKTLGKYEPKGMLKDASILDVYSLVNGNYQYSFYLYNHKGETLRQFSVYKDTLIALMGNYILTKHLKSEYFDF